VIIPFRWGLQQADGGANKTLNARGEQLLSVFSNYAWQASMVLRGEIDIASFSSQLTHTTDKSGF
jgi:hypothetical protein